MEATATIEKLANGHLRIVESPEILTCSVDALAKLISDHNTHLDEARAQRERAITAHSEMMELKERMIKLADEFGVDAATHRKLSDLGQTELTKICHRSAWDAYKNAERRVMDAVHNEAAF